MTPEKIQKMVREQGWMATAQTMVTKLRRGTYTGEKVRFKLLEKGLPEPSSPNAWGAVILSAKRNNVLVGTGVYVKPTSARSHSRKTEQYIKA